MLNFLEMGIQPSVSRKVWPNSLPLQLEVQKMPYVIPENHVRKAEASRGKRLHNLWWLWSRKTQRYLILPSDVALCHVVLLEGDTNVTSFELEAPSYCTQVMGRTVGTRFDAKVIFKDNTTAWDEVKAVVSPQDVETLEQIQAQKLIAEQHSQVYRLFTKQNLEPQLERVWNLLRMLQCVAAARDFSIAASKTQIVAKLSGNSCHIEELQVLGDGDIGLNLAAIFELYLDGHVLIDLDSAPIDASSVVSRGGNHGA